MSAVVEPVDLFGAPVMERSAIFRAPDQRLVLSRKWGPGPRALVIGCNPSDAGGKKQDDPTSLWWNRWFQHYGFGAYDAANLYPFVSPSPAECRRVVDGIGNGDWDARDALHFANLPTLVRLAKTADQVFVCWGNIAWDDDWIEHVVEEIQTGEAPWPDLWCWGTTKSGAPTHPMARGKHRLPWDAAPVLWRSRHGPIAPQQKEQQP